MQTEQQLICPKCSSHAVITRYCQGGVGCLTSRGNYQIPPSREHLDRQCVACGYGWATPTADRR